MHLPMDPGSPRHQRRNYRPWLVLMILVSATLALVNHRTPPHVKEEWKAKAKESWLSKGTQKKDSAREPGTLTELPAIGRHSGSIIFLHGLGLTARDNIPMLQKLRRQLFQISWQLPNANRKPVSAVDGRVIPAWFDMQTIENPSGTALPSDIDVESMQDAVARVHSVVESELARDILPERIVLAGFSQGCAISLLSMLSSKHKLGGLLCMSGWLPMINQIHRSSNGTMHPMQDPHSKSIPIFWGHGRDDSTVPPTWASASRKALKELGFDQIEFKQYDGLIHSVNQEELTDMHTWLSKHLAPV